MDTRPWIVHEADCPLEGWPEDEPGGVSWRTLFSADRTPTEGLTVGIAEIAAGPDKRNLHRHAQAEVYFVISGEGVVEIDGSDHPVRPGSAVFIPGDAQHDVRNTGAEPLRFLYAFPTASFSDVRYEFAGS